MDDILIRRLGRGDERTVRRLLDSQRLLHGFFRVSEVTGGFKMCQLWRMDDAKAALASGRLYQVATWPFPCEYVVCDWEGYDIRIRLNLRLKPDGDGFAMWLGKDCSVWDGKSPVIHASSLATVLQTDSEYGLAAYICGKLRNANLELLKAYGAQSWPHDPSGRMLATPWLEVVSVAKVECVPRGSECLPDAPATSFARAMRLKVGERSIDLLSDGTICIGRTYESSGKVKTDIVVDPPPGCPAERIGEYWRMSHLQCTIRREDRQILVVDGAPDIENGHIHSPSRNGTFLNGQQIEVAPLEDGYLSFGLPDRDTGPSLRVDVVGSSRNGAKEMPDCCRGKDACGNVILSRTDGVNETFAVLWSSLDLSWFDPALDGVTVFHDRGAFAWVRDGVCEWIMPGAKHETAHGVIETMIP